MTPVIKVQFLPPKMKKKYLRVTMPDGSKWDVPAEFIAEDRAASLSGDRVSPLFFEEKQVALDHPDVLIDWAENNMNWRLVVGRAVRVESATDADYQDGWVNGEKEVVEK